MDSRDDAQRAIREMLDEFGRAADGAMRLLRQGVEDAQRRMGTRRPPGGPGPGHTPGPGGGAEAAEAIRALGRLRDEGLISDDEFQAKKTELLRRM